MPIRCTLPLVLLLGLACVADPPNASSTDLPTTSASTSTLDSNSSSETTRGMSTSAEATGTTTTGLPPMSTGTEDDDGPLPPMFDMQVPDAPGMPRETPPWLVHLASIGGERHLFHVDIDTAIATDVCTVIDSGTMLPYTGGSPSVTFSRDDRLLFSTGTALYEIELPSCIATLIGDIGFGGVFGICPDEADDLYGLSSTSDVLIRIDAQTGVGTQVGSLGSDWSMLGGTWNEVDQQILGIDAVTDGLYEIDAFSGMANLLQALPLDFQNVGVEFHPLTEQIYACTTNSHLYRLEMDGSLTDLGDMGFDTCTNLGAPWSEGVELPTPM